MACVRSRGSGGPPSRADRKLRSRFVEKTPSLPGGASRKIIQADVVTWLDSVHQFEEGQSVLCSLPDYTEIGLDLDGYRAWWANVADGILSKLRPGQFAVFYQSDGKIWEGKAKCTCWLSKAALVSEAAGRTGATLLWHKIVTFGAGDALAPATAPMAVGRPNFSHLLCYGAPAPRGGAGYDPRASLSPDVFDRGPQLWDRGAGLVAAHVAAAFLAAQPQVSCVLSPCCGVGTFPAAANACGLAAVGVELNAGRCSAARELHLALSEIVAFRIETGTLPRAKGVSPPAATNYDCSMSALAQDQHDGAPENPDLGTEAEGRS